MEAPRHFRAHHRVLAQGVVDTDATIARGPGMNKKYYVPLILVVVGLLSIAKSSDTTHAALILGLALLSFILGLLTAHE